jgi:hypothetical protein
MMASGRQRRRHRNRAEADLLAAEYEGSGLSQAAFCELKDLSLKTLARYVTRYRKQSVQGGKSGTTRQRFVGVEVAVPNGAGELAVLLPGGRRIEVKRGFDAGTLRQLVSALEI